MRTLALLLPLLLPLPATALTPAIPEPIDGPWVCLNAVGEADFSFSILDHQTYVAASGESGTYVISGWGLIDFRTGPYAGIGGSFALRTMALMALDGRSADAIQNGLGIPGQPFGGRPQICILAS